MSDTTWIRLYPGPVCSGSRSLSHAAPRLRPRRAAVTGPRASCRCKPPHLSGGTCLDRRGCPGSANSPSSGGGPGLHVHPGSPGSRPLLPEVVVPLPEERSLIRSSPLLYLFLPWSPQPGLISGEATSRAQDR